MLSDFNFPTNLYKSETDITKNFYIPCMKNSVKYDRITGYFSSTIYVITWEALKEFIQNNGHMRIICSPKLLLEDLEALSKGNSAKADEKIAEEINKEIDELFNEANLESHALLLAYMVSNNIVDVKIAVMKQDRETDAITAMFHDKTGLFTDENKNTLAFAGSMNETYQGLDSGGNEESIAVSLGWMKDDRDYERVKNSIDHFERLWKNEVSNVIVYDFPEASKIILEERAKGTDWEKELYKITRPVNLSEKWSPDSNKTEFVLWPHQAKALENWATNGYKGIFKHATGSGKTFTAICAIKQAHEQNKTALVLVPSRELMKQWEEEVKKFLPSETRYLLCGDGNNDWKKENNLNDWTSSQSLKKVILSTYNTASSDEFLKKTNQGDHLFVVADEVHRIGSAKNRKILNLQSGWRLGLSATPERYGDPSGTKAIFDYFGGIVKPEFTLFDAIQNGVLTKYFYYPKTIKLTTDEQEEWNKVTKKINRIFAQLNSKEEPIDLSSNKQLENLLINRARIIKNAKDKVSLAANVISENYKDGDRWIVYCDNISQLNEVHKALIDLGIQKVQMYYAGMENDRKETLNFFSDFGGILVSIKCLDEGVDIPSTTCALILASSKNPREFIQRRGRVLRKYEGKNFSKIYDAIVLPLEKDDNNQHSIIATELARAIEFGEYAENPKCVNDLKNIARDYDIDYDSIYNKGFEEEEQ